MTDRADVYSLGIILYPKVLAARLPFWRRAVGLLRDASVPDMTPLSRSRGLSPQSVVALVEEMMRKTR